MVTDRIQRLEKSGVDTQKTIDELEVDDPFAHFGARHEARSIEFAETILEHSPGDTTRVETAIDAGWQAFVDPLRTD